MHASLARLSLLTFLAGLAACQGRPRPAVPTPAFDEHDLRARVARRVKPYLGVHAKAGLAIGVQVGEERFFYGFGRARNDGERPPDGDTLFEIGSITKAVAGVLLADAVARKEAKLDDPVERLLPGKSIPARDGRKITLLHLATNGSGLPMMPTNWVRVDEGPYTPEMFDDFLASYTLPWAPGARTMYSNVGFGLLGMALSARAGRPFGELVEKRVLDPLGMSSTAILGRRRVEENVAQGHDDDWKDVPDRWDQPRLPACCALESTTADLLRLVRASLRPSTTPLGPALLDAQTARVTAIGELEDQKLALGWFVDEPRHAVWKGGQMKGYRSTLAIDRAFDAGVVVLANGGNVDTDGLGFGLLRELHRMKEERDPVALSTVGALPAAATRLEIDFGQSIRLLGFVAPTKAHPGETLAFEYFYRCLAPVDRDYRIFVHGDAIATKARVRGDHYPQASTDRWPAGAIVRDRFTLQLPQEWTAGDFVVWTGFYEGVRRLEVLHGAPTDGKHRVRGPTITVEP